MVAPARALLRIAKEKGERGECGKREEGRETDDGSSLLASSFLK